MANVLSYLWFIVSEPLTWSNQRNQENRKGPWGAWDLEGRALEMVMVGYRCYEGGGAMSVFLCGLLESELKSSQVLTYWACLLHPEMAFSYLSNHETSFSCRNFSFKLLLMEFFCSKIAQNVKAKKDKTWLVLEPPMLVVLATSSF